MPTMGFSCFYGAEKDLNFDFAIWVGTLLLDSWKGDRPVKKLAPKMCQSCLGGPG